MSSTTQLTVGDLVVIDKSINVNGYIDLVALESQGADKSQYNSVEIIEDIKNDGGADQSIDMAVDMWVYDYSYGDDGFEIISMSEAFLF